MSKSEIFDVIIVGGGIVGLTLANLLARDYFSVALIDEKPFSTTIDIEKIDLRVSAITHASKNIFMHLGVWSTIEQLRVTPFRHMTVWDEMAEHAQIDFDCLALALPQLGYIIENKIMVFALAQSLQQCSSITLFTAKPEKINVTDQGCQLHLNDGTHLHAELIIGADGANSWVRTQQQIAMTTHAYQQTAIVANVKTQHSHQHTAWQRFLTTGPLAFLPLANSQYCSIVWSCHDDRARELMQLAPNHFNHELTSAFANKLGAVELLSERIAFPLIRRHAKQYVQPRMALVGDAIHTIHPLAGQGVNLGILDAAALAELMITAKNTQQTFFNYGLLRRYERWRKGHNVAVMSAMDGFHWLFTQKNLPAIWLRSAGLMLTNKISWLKKFFMQQAMGLSDDFPRVTRVISNK